MHLFSSNQFPPPISDSESADPLIGGWLVNRALAKLFSERQPKTDQNINSFKLHWQRNLFLTVRSIFLYNPIWISFLIMSNIQIIITFLMLKISPVLIFIMPLYALSTRGHCNIANNHLNNQQALAVLLSNLIIKLTDLLLFAIPGEKNNDRREASLSDIVTSQVNISTLIVRLWFKKVYCPSDVTKTFSFHICQNL